MNDALKIVTLIAFTAGCRGDDAHLTAEVARLTAENEALRAEVKRLGQEAEARAVEDQAAPGDAAPPSGKPKLLGTPSTAADPLEAAKDAYVHGHYQQAIELATAHAKEQPDAANKLIGASYCFMKDQKRAQTAYDRADPKGQQFLKYVCGREGITIGR